MKKLTLLILVIAAVAPVLGDPPPFVKIGETYTVVRPGEKPLIVTLRRDEGNGWYRAQLAGVLDEAYVNLAGASIIVPGAQATAWGANAEGIKKSITNNLRQLAAAADQYFLENGVSQVAAKELIGPPQFVKELKSVDGEDYTSLVVQLGRPIKVKTRSGIEVEYQN